MNVVQYPVCGPVGTTDCTHQHQLDFDGDYRMSLCSTCMWVKEYMGHAVHG